jgi:hypothetical protein
MNRSRIGIARLVPIGLALVAGGLLGGSMDPSGGIHGTPNFPVLVAVHSHSARTLVDGPSVGQDTHRGHIGPRTSAQKGFTNESTREPN